MGREPSASLQQLWVRVSRGSGLPLAPHQHVTPGRAQQCATPFPNCKHLAWPRTQLKGVLAGQNH
eukprot:2669535-Rhodomonas_salina.2